MTSKTTPILILGMGRSGTSCLAGSLQQAGVYFGEVSTKNKHNRYGNRENNTIMQLNDSILHFNHARWNHPPLQTIRWNQDHVTEGKRIIDNFQTNCPSGYWAFKDPRTLLTYPFWAGLLPHAKRIGTVRHPYHVALSLSKRGDKSTITEGMRIWLAYNNVLLKLLQQHPFPLVSFDWPSKEYTKKQQKIINDIVPNYHNHSIDFYDDTLRTNIGDTPITLPDAMYQCYLHLLKYTK